MHFLIRVGQLKRVYILNQAFFGINRNRALITFNHHPNFCTLTNTNKQSNEQHHQYRAIYQYTWTQSAFDQLLLGELVLHAIFSIIANQSALITHLVHNFVARINTCAATNTFVLQTIANINPCRTNIHTHTTVNTITFAYRTWINAFFARTTRLTTRLVVGHD